MARGGQSRTTSKRVKTRTLRALGGCMAAALLLPACGPDTNRRSDMLKAKGLEYEEHGQGEAVLLIHGAFISDALSLVARE